MEPDKSFVCVIACDFACRYCVCTMCVCPAFCAGSNCWIAATCQWCCLCSTASLETAATVCLVPSVPGCVFASVNNMVVTDREHAEAAFDSVSLHRMLACSNDYNDYNVYWLASRRDVSITLRSRHAKLSRTLISHLRLTVSLSQCLPASAKR